jgi:hypothetical protein
MCCNSQSQLAPANESKSDHVNETLVATPLPDGYWIHAFPFLTDSKYPDIVAYGLGFEGKPATVKLLWNPLNVKWVILLTLVATFIDWLQL